MWLKFKASSIKEALLLARDRAGIAMLFIMPMFLILIMSLLQQSTITRLEENKTPLLVINYDQDTFGLNVIKGLKKAAFFDVHENIKGKIPSENELKQLVLSGKYRVGIIIHQNASEQLRLKIKKIIQNQFPESEGQLFENIYKDKKKQVDPKVEIYFDPIIKVDFKHAVTSALREFSASVEAKMIFEIYSELFHDMVDIQLKETEGFGHMVSFDEQYATGRKSRIIPNAVQHNVPAWTIFAMFFIVIPLAGNIIKERESGMSLRLKTMPGSNLAIIMGKVSVYFVVGILQAISMLLIGILILPVFGMPSLTIGSEIFPLILVTLSVSLAASGYGVLIGSIATTQEQSSIFGSISVVILAALGGIWVPTFMMSEMMNSVSKLSPLNWGLNAYYDIFLRNANTIEVMPYIIPLVLFTLGCIIVAWFYNRYKQSFL
jgi:ABC-2 type transport system permease protein